MLEKKVTAIVYFPKGWPKTSSENTTELMWSEGDTDTPGVTTWENCTL
jgi:hypothetical protein